MSQINVRRSGVFGLLLLFAFVEISCVIQQNPVSGRNRVFGYSWNQELELGKQADKEISEFYGIYQHEQLDTYITGIGEELLSHSHMRREDAQDRFRETEFEFRVLDSEVVNAFALPGGYNYVTRGMLAHMENEAQLAMVLGHEIGHVAARHASQRAARQQAGQILLIGGAVLGQELLGLPGQDLLQLGSAAAQLVFLSYSRSNEREADKLGVEYAAMAGYQSEEGAGFFVTMQRLTERAGGGLPNILSSHPDPGNRERDIKRMAEEWREKGYEQEDVGRDRLFDRIDGMVWGVDPRKGLIEEERYYHPDNEFTFPLPSGWKSMKQRNQVLAHTEDQEAFMLFEPSTAETEEEAIRRITDREGMQQVGVEEDPRSDKGAWRGTALVESDGELLQLFLYAVEHDDQVYRFLGVAKADKFENYQSDFWGSARGFERLTDQQYLDVQPIRVSIETVEQETTFEELLPDELPRGVEAEEIAIMNQRYLDDTVEAGSRIKMLQE